MNVPSEITKVAILVNKLLALAKDSGATEAEASLAAEKAQALMTEHNLSMANIEAAGGQSGDDGKRIKDGVVNRSPYKWQRTLMSALAELNFCYCREEYKYHRHTKSFDGYQLIGRAANVASVRVMFEYLLSTIDRLAKAEILFPDQYFTRYAHSFKEGCADRIIDRLKERRAEEVTAAERNLHPEAATSNALVVVVLGDYVQDEDDLNEDFRKGWKPGTTKQRRIDDELEYQTRRAEQERRYEQRKAEWLARDPDIDPIRLDYLAQGFTSAQVDELLAPTKSPKVETEAQRSKRKAREQREYDRWQQQQYRQDGKKDWTGYHRGQEAGAGVGLDKQVDISKTKGIT